MRSIGTALTRHESLTFVVSTLILLALGAFSLWLYDNAQFLHRFTQGITAYIATYIGQFALYLVACLLVLRRRSKSRAGTIVVLFVILVFGVLFRGRLVTQPPYLSSDVHRYVWDGWVQAHGINPYKYVPAAPELAHLRDEEVYPLINRREYAQTIYPPVAQALFLLSHLISPLSIGTFKYLMAAFDGLTVIAIILGLIRLGLDPCRVIFFAWHPLVVWEGSHSGHLESATMAFIALALLARVRGRPMLTGVSLAAATLTKFYPALLLPLFAVDGEQHDSRSSRFRLDSLGIKPFLKRINVRTAGVFFIAILVAYLPYLGVGLGVIGFLPGYFREEGFTETGERYFLLNLIRTVLPFPAWLYSIACIAALALLVLYLLQKQRHNLDLIRGCTALIGLFLFLSSPRYSWYTAWIIPFLCFVPNLAWLYVTGSSVLLYILWITKDYPNIPLWLGAAMYLPAFAVLVIEYLKHRARSSTMLEQSGGGVTEIGL